MSVPTISLEKLSLDQLLATERAFAADIIGASESPVLSSRVRGHLIRVLSSMATRFCSVAERVRNVLKRAAGDRSIR